MKNGSPPDVSEAIDSPATRHELTRRGHCCYATCEMLQRTQPSAAVPYRFGEADVMALQGGTDTVKPIEAYQAARLTTSWSVRSFATTVIISCWRRPVR